MSADAPIPLGPFDLHRPIGRGGMAEVWAGLHRRQRVPVAVKVITAAQAREARFREAFRREVQAVARLRHPGIVLVLDHGHVPEDTASLARGQLAAGAPYLAMELASLGSLDEVELPLRWPDLYPILLALLDALAHAHARGVVHRDLKPGNVLMASASDARPGVKLTDFGIAHALETEIDSPEEAAASGTPMYMAPEQFMGKWRDYGPWTDLYAVGCLAYTLGTGRTPFRGKNLAQLAYDHMSRPPPDLEAGDALPPALGPWIRRLMDKDPQDRFRRAADAAWALTRLAEGRWEPPSPPPPRAPSSDPEPPTLLAPEADAQDILQVPAARRVGAGTSEAAVASAPIPPPRPRASTELEATALEAPAPGLGSAIPTHFDAPRAIELHTVVQATQLADALPWAGASGPPPPSGAARADREVPPLPGSWARGEAPEPSVRLVGASLSLFGLRSLPVVDRLEDRDRLWADLHRVRERGRAQARVLSGHAGHGKSRLVQWIAERADEVGSAQILKATHGPTAGPSDGLPRMVARFLRSVDLEPEALLERTRVQLEAQGVEDPYEWQALAALMHPGVGGVRFSNARERHVLIRRLLERLSRERPVILWLDDVQWGADSLAFAVHLLRAQAESPAPILVLATARAEALPERPVERKLLDALLETPGAKSHPLPPLAPADHRQLVQEMLLLDDALAGQVALRTGGNPLFAIQLVGDWVERGVLEVGERGFVLQPGEAAELPDDIHAVWAARVDRVLAPLPVVARKNLEIAAVLGLSVDTGEWYDACREAGLAIPPLLVIALMENHLAVPTEGGWSFTHAMLRESLERSAADAGRLLRHHAACARMLVRRYGRHTFGVAERLGAHYLAAREPELALEPLLRGAHEHLETSELGPALDLVARRDEALDALGAPDEDPRRGPGWVLRARVYALRGRFDDAARWASRAVDRARGLGWRRVLPDALVAQATVAHERGDQGAAMHAFDEARRLYAGLGDRLGVAHCLVGRGEAVYRLGDLPKAERFLSEGLELYEAEKDRSGTARALLRLGLVALWRGEPERARHFLTRQLDVLEGLGDRFQTARCIAALGELARQVGDFDEAERAYRKALAIDEAIGSRNAWMERLNLGLVLLARGDFAAAGHLSARVERDLGPRAEPSQRCAVLIQRLPSLAEAGDWAGWDRALGSARALLEETGLTDGDVAWLLGLAADRARRAGEPHRARPAAALAARQWRALGRPDKAEAVQADA